MENLDINEHADEKEPVSNRINFLVDLSDNKKTSYTKIRGIFNQFINY